MKIIKQNQMVIFTILFFSLLHAIPIFILNLGYDEAYYWQWSQHLALGYFDHPPMVAYFIYLGTKFFGGSPLAVRASILLVNVIASVSLYIITTRTAKNKKAGLFSIILFNLLPIFALGQIMITPDIPQIMFISLAILLSYFLLDEQSDSLFLWICLGITLGASLMSKYTSLIFIAVIYSNILFNKKYRYLLASYKPYLSVILMLLTFMPNLYWNLTHNWDSFLFQFYNRHNVHINHFESFFSFVGLQFAITGFFLFLFIPVIYRDIKHNGITLLNSLAIAPVVFFTIISLFVKMRFYWATLSYIPMIILFAKHYAYYYKRTVGLIAFNLLMFILIVIHLYAPLVVISQPQGDAYGDINGWIGVRNSVEQFMNNQINKKNWVIISNDFHVAASADYNLPNKYKIFSLPGNNKREGNYYWQDESSLYHKNALIIEDSQHGFNPEDLYNCDKITKYKNIDVVYKDTLYRKITIYTCINFKNRK